MELYPRIFFACHTRHVRDEESGTELTSHQASILDHLDERAPLSLRALALHMGVTPATMSIHINRLAAKRLVNRRRNPVDGRGVQLTLSKDGARIRDSKSVLDSRLVEAMLSRLDQSELDRALEGLALLARAAGRLMVSHTARRKDGRDKMAG